MTASLKTTDASARVDASVTFKLPSSSYVRERANILASRKFYVLVVFNNNESTVLGDTVPLECSSVDFDSNANAAMYTFTLSSPEGSAGNQGRDILASVADTIISKSV